MQALTAAVGLLGAMAFLSVPPTSGLTERLFGVVFFSHQTDSFLSAWLGGVCLASSGYMPVWLADALLSASAAALSFKIQDDREIL